MLSSALLGYGWHAQHTVVEEKWSGALCLTVCFVTSFISATDGPVWASPWTRCLLWQTSTISGLLLTSKATAYWHCVCDPFFFLQLARIQLYSLSIWYLVLEGSADYLEHLSWLPSLSLLSHLNSDPCSLNYVPYASAEWKTTSPYTYIFL